MAQIETGLSNNRWTSLQIKNTMYLHNIIDGFRKYDGSSVSSITQAQEKPAAPIVTGASVQGQMIEPADYKWVLTFSNPKLGIESEASDETEASSTASGGRRINAVTIPSPYTHLNIYRTVADGSEFFFEFQTEVQTGTVESGAADETLGKALDTTIDVIDVPKGNFIVGFKGFIFTLQDYTIRHTHIAATDADNYYLESDKFEINTKSGGTITGGGVIGDTFLVATPTRIFGITGSSSTDFTFNELKRGVGIASHDTIDTDTDGNMIAFSGSQGVIRIKENDIKRLTEVGQIIEVERLSSPDLDLVFNGTDTTIKLDRNTYSKARGYIDQDDNVYHLFVSDKHFIVDLDDGQWSLEEDYKVTSALYVKTSNQHSAGYTTDNQGFLIRENLGYSKLAPTGDNSGSPTSATRDTLTDTGALFETLGDGLKGAFVIVDHDTFTESRQIISNSGTSITVNSPWDSIPSTNDTYYIGYIQCKVLTKQYQLGEDSVDKQRGYTMGIFHEISEEEQQLIIKWFTDKKDSAVDAKVVDLSSKIYDEVGMTSRSRFLQVYLFTQYNKKTSRDGSPVIINSYVFFTNKRGKI